MTTIVNTNMTQRGRVRAGRRVRYTPTAAEATSYGAGPYSATIVQANPDGSADLLLDLPNTAAAGAAPLTTSADAAAQGGAYVQADVQSIADLANELKADHNALAAIADRQLMKTGVRQGGGAGQFTLYGVIGT